LSKICRLPTASLSLLEISAPSGEPFPPIKKASPSCLYSSKQSLFPQNGGRGSGRTAADGGANLCGGLHPGMGAQGDGGLVPAAGDEPGGGYNQG
jgi:hypothetical protein